MHTDFAGRNVVVTGGTGALGSAVVKLLADEGAVCHVPCPDEAELRRFDLADNPLVRVKMVGDLGEEREVTAYYAAALESGALWASINVAGGFAMAGITETSAEMFRAEHSRNVMTAFLCSREAVRLMRRTGGGRIVNVTARAGVSPEAGAGMVAYTCAKAAVAALTRALAAEVAGENILVNAVAPSIMDTPANRSAMPGANHEAWPKTWEVAGAIVFLASPENRVARGSVVTVYGRA